MKRLIFAPLALAVLFFPAWLIDSRLHHPKNVILIVVDALRADRISAYGYSRPTPNIDRLAAHGALFENAFAPLPMTQPSFTTIFTSLEPHSHGIKWNDNVALSDHAITIAEILRDHGWQTAAVVGASNLDSVFGLNQGFEFFEDNLQQPLGQKSIGHIARWERSAQEVDQVVLQWLDHRNSGRPFFLMIHYFDPHDPYAPPPPFRYGDSKSDLYDGEVAYVDQQIGALIDQLEGRGLARDSLIVLTADHGEAMGEHDVIGHKWQVYDESLHVPLILTGPGIPRGIRNHGLVQHIDLAPTLLDYLDLSRPRFYQGISLLPILTGKGKPHDWILSEKGTPPARAYQEQARWKQHPYSQWAIRSKKEKFIWSSDGHYEFYDLEKDPYERNNLFEPERERALELFKIGFNMRTRLPQFRFDSHPGRKKGDADAEEALRALGYLN